MPSEFRTTQPRHSKDCPIHGTTARAASRISFPAPDPYKAGLDKMRHAADARPKRSTAAQLGKFAPPNGYQIALDKMKENR